MTFSSCFWINQESGLSILNIIWKLNEFFVWELIVSGQIEDLTIKQLYYCSQIEKKTEPDLVGLHR